MWVKFPKGSESLSVEQQQFNSEYHVKLPDDDFESHWTRVPDHLIDRVLSMNLGYGALPRGQTPPGCVLDDLAVSDPNRDDKVGTLALQVDALTKSNIELTAAIRQSEEQRNQAETECAILRARLKDLEQEFTDYKGANPEKVSKKSEEVKL